MNMPATAFLFVGMIVLALAVIAMAIWVASLSGRIRRLSDRMMYDATAQPAPRPNLQHTRQSPAATGPYAQQPLQPSGSLQPSGPLQPSGSIQPMATGAQTVRSVQPAVARVHANAVQPMEQPDDGQSFFENYRSQSESQQTGAFGRERPTIPFGEDRNHAARLDAYTEDAISGDFDPDSIDFSRVAGYRNIRPQ